jgi:hypothetical protein
MIAIGPSISAVHEMEEGKQAKIPTRSTRERSGSRAFLGLLEPSKKAP